MNLDVPVADPFIASCDPMVANEVVVADGACAWGAECLVPHGKTNPCTACGAPVHHLCSITGCAKYVPSVVQEEKGETDVVCRACMVNAGPLAPSEASAHQHQANHQSDV